MVCHLDLVPLPLPEVLSQLYNTAKNTYENIGIDAPFMRLINDDDRILRQQKICG